MEETTVTLPFEAIDDLIYSARAGDIEDLKADITKLSKENGCSPGKIIESAIDTEDESEGGTGACLLHWPAANGNIDILNYILGLLAADSPSPTGTLADPAGCSRLINHRNNSGNTPLHWAALNTHLDCVKALVEAGADVRLKNDAGHDAAFLAERAEWAKQGDEVASAADEKNEEDTRSGESENTQPMSEGMQVVRVLLESDKSNEAEQNETEGDADANADRMDADDRANGGATA